MAAALGGWAFLALLGGERARRGYPAEEKGSAPETSVALGSIPIKAGTSPAASTRGGQVEEKPKAKKQG
ncbi:MAG TPA: hypothetical protein VG326_14840 [Tepidisphaeraceae bacterium]|nr:hypothetical protein [Tepidisphaeraceae bacterium]